MLKKIRLLFTKKSSCPPLEALDAIYSTAISQLPIASRREYCQRLISRTEYECKTTKCKNDLKRLEQMLQSANMKISELDRKTKVAS